MSGAGTIPTRRLAWRRALVAAAVLRAAVALLAVLAPGLLAVGEAVAVEPLPGFAGWAALPAAGLDLVGAGLERFDALWYLAIADAGYPATADGVPQAVAFFPGYPALVAAVGAVVGGRLLLAAELVSFVATVVALAGVHELAVAAAVRWGEPAPGDVGRRAVVLLASFPTAFFLVAPYSESLFLALTAWALVLAGRHRWGAVAALGLAAGTVRPLGAVLALPLVLLALGTWPSRRAEGERRSARALRRMGAVGAAATPVLGLLLVGAAAWSRYGAPLAVLDVQAAWQRQPVAPWTSLGGALRLAWQFGGYWLLDLVVFLPVLVAVVWLVVRDRVLGLYALGHVAVWFLAPFADRPLLSVPRFALAVAPLAVVLAVWTHRRGAETATVALQAGLLGLHMALFTTWAFVF